MDNRLIIAIRDDRTLPTGYHKSILVMLASRGDNAFPNQSQLMKDAGIGSKNTLIKTVKELEALGWLTVTKDKWKSNQYKNNRYKVHIPVSTKPGIKYDINPNVKTDNLNININKYKQKDKHNNKNNKKPRDIFWKVNNLSAPWPDMDRSDPIIYKETN
jgi:hypothetical protein